MRVLLVTPAAPSPTHVNGGATRQHRLYRRLIELGNQVTVATVFTAEQQPSIAALRAEGFVLAPHLRARTRAWEVLRALVRRPQLIAGVFSKPIKELIASILWVDLEPIVRAELARGDFDIVVIEGSFAAYWRESLETQLPVVLVTHEVESVHLEAKADLVGGLPGALRRIDARRVRRSEQNWTAGFDLVIVMSEQEGRLLSSIVGAERVPQVEVVGNGADIDAMQLVEGDPDQGLVAFTGTLNYPPNVSGARWLAREVWPIVRHTESDAKLIIAGADPGPEILALGQLEGVEVHANPADMREWFSRASICTLPMLEGGGTRLKLIDAFAAGRAVVSTTNGASGVDCADEREVLIADSVEDFAAAVVRLLNDRSLRSRLGSDARKLAESRYDWNQLGERFDFVLAETIARKTPPIA